MMFHLSVAVVMGLNGFFFAFVATYPCVWFASDALHAWFAGL